MSGTATDASIIIPTMATRERAGSLARAIMSVLEAGGLPIVVVNGTRYDAAVLAQLEQRTDIRLFVRAEPGVSGARELGRENVATTFFGTLDDDDELMRHSISARARPMMHDAGIDVVISNGLHELDGKTKVSIESIDRYQEDPLLGLVELCWLNSAGGLYRTSRVEPGFFSSAPNVMEWTYLAFQLAMTRRLLFLNEPTFINHLGTAGSLSKSRTYHTEAPEVLTRMLRWDMPARIRPLMEKKLTATLHEASEFELESGNVANAWRFHLRSLGARSGLRYVPYTRHILFRQIAGRRGSK